MGLSFVVHLAICLVLAFVTMYAVAPRDFSVPAVQSRWDDHSIEETSIEPLDVESLATIALDPANPGGQKAAVNPLAAALPTPDRTTEPVEVRDIDTMMPSEAWSGSDILEHANEEVGLASFSELNIGGEGDGSGLGDGAGEGFFGISGVGKKHVFVVDASRSMNHPHNSPAKTRFGRLKIELVKTIGNMSEEAEFFVIFFNDRAIPMPAAGLIPATPSNQFKSLEWVALAKPDGRTDPRDALLMALRLDPDVVYFLTDGEFAYRVVKDVAEANVNKTPIYTFCFSDRSGEEYLKQIAAQNDGKYHYVP